MEVETLLTPSELADKLRTTVGNLARQRSMKTGPPYVKLGHSVRYRSTDVARWLEKQTHTTDGVE